MAARSRLLKELREAHQHVSDGIVLTPNEDNFFVWTAEIPGPKDSPYENGRWKLRFTCTPQYPLSPPSVEFTTKCFHPNIDFKTGEICLDILKGDKWTPAWNLHFVCVAIASLLDQPNAYSPLNCDAGNLIRSNDIRGFNSMARMYTYEYAISDSGK